MDRREFLTGIGAGIVLIPAAGAAQPARKLPHIGFLVMAQNPGVEDAFPRGLRDLGYIEGRDVIVERRSADGRTDRMRALAAEMVRLGVDLIVAGGPEARRAAREATSTIPIVVVGGVDPMGEGWAASLARPGGSVTGLTVTHPGMASKKLEFLKEIVPGLTRVAVLRDPAAEGLGTQSMAAMRATGQSLGVDVQFIDVGRLADFDDAFRQAIKNRRRAVIVAETAMVFAHRVEIADGARRNRLPIIGEWKASAQAGFLLSYGADLGDLLRRAAIYVDKILRGARAGDLPVERPDKFELVINLKTAKALGLVIPPSVLARADEIIQ